MRIVCHLREIRAHRSLGELQDASGVSKGTLSLIERGRMFPADKDLDALEAAYGAPAHQWYEPPQLLLLQKDVDE